MKFREEILWLKHNEHTKEDIDNANKLVESDKYYRPLYHLAPPNGLLNDPNGLLFKDGVHHIHYQWSPIQPYHGFKHWLYVTTKDFVTYEDKGVSIVPDIHEERSGAFSGSAYDFGDKVKIYYTGNIEENGHMIEEVQIAADLIDGKVLNKKVVINGDLNEFTPNTRDPKIFEYKGQKYMIFGVQNQKDKLGGVAFYKMINPEEFEYFKTLKPSLGIDYGYMWECPNLDLLGDKMLFMMSAEGWNKDDNKYELNNSRNVVYTAIKDLDLENGKLNELFEMITMDYGHDFYAPQTYWVKDKLVMIGWFGTIGVQYPTDDYSWHSMLTIPRELSWSGNTLVQKPFKDFEKNVLVDTKQITTDSIENKQALHLKFNLDDNLKITLKNDKDEEVVIEFTEKEIILDRSKQSEEVDFEFESPRYALRKEKEQVVEMYIDRSAIEIFADNYKTIFTSRFFIKDFNKIIFDKSINIEISDINPLILKK
ncbi:beta-fructofuranosidase [Spiroplasma chinense]|uniref:beta-fructofuranosidase n=1 Tax=Spiroplasma chinense TaxID=216932 RepID=A0A5B9Y5Y9_9MOLU|nr:glycoside hydrolase family 32 protein [Spiroplasma chinense]QEH62265.1 beta-fructofuranosidase [Spiroplasma chinense]